MIGNGTILLDADIWESDLIVPDIWTQQEVFVDPAEKADEYANYYLLQMNFTGNVIQ